MIKRKQVRISDTATVVGAPNFSTIFFAVQNTTIEPIPLILEAAPAVREKIDLILGAQRIRSNSQLKQNSNQKEFWNPRFPSRRKLERNSCAIPNRSQQRFAPGRKHLHQPYQQFPLQL